MNKKKKIKQLIVEISNLKESVDFLIFKINFTPEYKIGQKTKKGQCIKIEYTRIYPYKIIYTFKTKHIITTVVRDAQKQ